MWRAAAVAAALLVVSPLAAVPAARRHLGAPAARPDPALAAQLESARAHAGAGRFAEAIAAYTAAAAEAEAQQLPAVQAQALEGLARAEWASGALPLARRDARAALALRAAQDDRLTLSRAARLLSEIEEAAGDRPAAFAAADRARAAAMAGGDPAEQARAGLRWAWLMPSGAARAPALESAVALAREAGGGELLALALHRLGDSFFNVANYEAALPALEEAEGLYRDLGLPDDRGRVFNSLGRVYRAHGRLDEALRLQQQALALHEQAGEPLSLVQSLNAVSAVYQRLQDYPNARAYLDRALALVHTTGSPVAEDFLRANLAAVLNDSGEYARAAAILETVIARGRDSFMSLRHGQLAFAYSHLGRAADALAAPERGVAACGEEADACANAFMFRAEAFRATGNLPAARRDVDTALAALDRVRAGLVPTDYFKQNFYDLYRRGISTAIALNVQDGQGRRALEIAEGARSRALLDLLRSRTGEAGAPAGSRTLRQQQLADPSTVESLVAAARRLDSMVLSYWVADDAVFIWVVTPQGEVHSQRVDVLRSTLTALVAATAPVAPPASAGTDRPPTIVTRGDRQAAAQAAAPTAWRSLHQLLVAPVRAHLPRAPGALLTIIANGPLQTVSFAALQDERGRYLLEDYALHYASAGALLQFTDARRHTAPRRGAMLLVSDPVTAPLSKLDRPLPRLAGARSEAQAIARLVPAVQVAALTGAAAGETAVRRGMTDKAVLHFATHAVVRDDEPFSSYLALAPSPAAGTAGDGFLRAEDIYDLDLRADLVVLSACRSAAGTVAGDGVATFARAFVFAGAASIVASVWDVADQPTSRLLPDFYRAWLGGAPKARALRRAQLALLAELRAGRVRVATPVGPVPLSEHPAFWAGFALFGEPE